MDFGDDMKVILPNQFLPVKAIKKHKIDEMVKKCDVIKKGVFKRNGTGSSLIYILITVQFL